LRSSGGLAGVGSEGEGETTPVMGSGEVALGDEGKTNSEGRQEKTPAKQVKKVMILVKGKNRIHCRQVDVSPSVLNKSDVFILDAGDKIYDWNGVHSSRKKRAKGLDVANRINKYQRNHKSEVIIIEDEQGEAPKDFWEALGGKPDHIPLAHADDELKEKEWNETDKLWRVNPGKELFAITGKFTRARLDSKFPYILECGPGEMYVWCGKACEPHRKDEAMKKAIELFKGTKKEKKVRPKWATLLKIQEGREPILFQEKFHQWDMLGLGLDAKRASHGRRSKQSITPQSSTSSPLAQTSSSSGIPLFSFHQDSYETANVADILKEYDDKVFTYQQLKDGDYPASLDTKRKESYLSDTEFKEVFNMTKDEFYHQPKWKQDRDKREKDLF
jgi:hypothetical protein